MEEAKVRGTGAVDVGHEVMALIAAANADLLVRVLQGEEPVAGDPVMVALSAARNLGVVVEDILRSLARQARSNGHTWAEIGEVLHVTRQAALQRFGGLAGDIDPGDPALPPRRGAASRATRLLDQFLHRQWDQLRAGFDDRMTNACSVELLDSVRAMVETVGEFVEMGSPRVVIRDGYTVVDVPLVFSGGQRTGRVTFNGAGQVAGFFVLPGALDTTP